MQQKIDLKEPLRGELFSEDFPFFVAKRVLDEAYDRKSTFHWHNYFELEVVTAGHGVHCFNGATYDLQRGSAYLVTPLDFHKITSAGSAPLSLVHIKFGYGIPDSAVTERIGASPTPIAAEFEEESFGEFEQGLLALLREYLSPVLDSEAMIRAVLNRLCLLLLRRAKRRAAAVPSPRAGHGDSSVIQRIASFLQYNFRSAISLSGLAEQYHFTPNYLGELFSRTMGVSFHTYLTRLRLDYAFRLLTHTSLKINQISAESGFQSDSYFISAFRKAYGVTPAQYRKNGITANSPTIERVDQLSPPGDNRLKFTKYS